MRPFVLRRFLTVPVTHLKKGEYINYKDRIFYVADISRHAQGRGGSFYKLELKDCLNNNKATERVNSTVSFDYAERRIEKLKYGYASNYELFFFDKDYNEFAFPVDSLDGGIKNAKFLKENTDVIVEFYGDASFVKIKLPKDEVYTVTEVGSAILIPAGDSRKIAYKQGVLETGAELQVPEFISAGDQIVVDIENGAYVSRVNKV